jgi:protein TonB
MPDPTAPAKPISAAGKPKEYPWQPVSKLAEPMASALRIAAETATKSSASGPEIASSTSQWSSEPAKETFSSSLSGLGAGVAAAPAKESPKPPAPGSGFTDSIAQPEPASRKSSTSPMQALQFEPPTFAALAVKDHEEEEETEGGGKKAYVIIALVVLATIFTGYVALQKMHSSGAPSSAPASQAATTQAPATGSGPAAETAPAPNTPPSPQEITLAPPKSAEPASKKPTPDVAASKPFNDVTVTKFSAGSQNTAPAAKPADTEAPQPQAIVVKNNTAPAAPKSADAEVTPPPAMPAPSDDKALSGIVAVTPAAVAKPVAAATLKVSQGVSQGLLVKRVQPVYPSQALQMRIEGTVLLDANIAKDGRISNVKVVKGEGVLSRAAVDAVKQWRYNPYLLNGEPVEIQTQISITFKLP